MRRKAASSAFAGISRSGSVSVDETAVTLKLRPLRPRSHVLWVARWPIAAAATVAALCAAAMLVVDSPEATPAQRAAAPSARAVALPPGDAGPILASAVLPSSTEDVLILDEDVGEIVILDEPDRPRPEKGSRATRRAHARSIARDHTNAGETARAVGDLAAAKHEFEAALTALPSYGPAAAGLAEIQMKQGSYRSALRYAKRASRSAPRKLDYMLLLGDAYFRTNNRAAAEKLWRKATSYGSADAKSRLAGRAPSS